MSKGDETRKNIIEAATMIFAQKGYKNVSMTDICEATRLSRGGLYRHYSSTAEIFREIVTDDYSFDERIRKGDRALEILKDTLTYVVEALNQKEKSLSLAIYEYASMEDNRGLFHEIDERARKRWKDLIEYGMKTGEFCTVDAEAVAEMILYYYQGLRMWSKVVDMDEKTSENYRKTVLLVLSGGKNED